MVRRRTGNNNRLEDMDRHNNNNYYIGEDIQKVSVPKTQTQSMSEGMQGSMSHSTFAANRNRNLLRMLDRIDVQAATLATQTNRLRLLKVSVCMVYFVLNEKKKQTVECAISDRT